VRLAMIFPGQGSQFVGMGADVAAAFPVARAVFAQADDILGYGLTALCAVGPLATLTETRHAQPALLTHSVAVLRVLEQHGIEPVAVAGHSLGEYSALVAAQVLDFGAALRLVRQRGELMFESGVDVPGTMAAVIGVPCDAIERACAAARPLGVCEIANINAPDQIVISGAVPAVEDAMRRLLAGGAKVVKQLNVSGAFHSALMRGPGEKLAVCLRATSFADAAVPVFPNFSGEPATRSDVLRQMLERQISAPVRWDASMRALRASFQEPVLEVGPGGVLKGLLRRIDRDAACTSVGDRAGLEALLAKTPTA
jgi:[acyl-carrier-protein] S-malonyltransferase